MYCKNTPPNLDNRVHDGQKCLLNCLNIDCEKYSENEIDGLNTYVENCQGGHYDNNFWNCKINTNLMGHYESELYFEEIKNEIIKEFQPKNEILEYAKNYIQNIRDTYKNCQIVALHFRRGDYSNIFNEYSTPEWNTWYLNLALNEVTDVYAKIFLVFTGGNNSEGNDNNADMEWCKQFIKGNNILYCENNDTIRDFTIMSNCDHLITNSMSSIFWWAAYLNNNPKKKIIVPILGYKNAETYWPESFIKISI